MSADADDRQDNAQHSADTSRHPESGDMPSDSTREEEAARQAQHEDNRPFPSLPERLETGITAIEHAVHDIGDVAGHATHGLSEAVGKIWEEVTGSFEHLRAMDPAVRLSDLAQIGILAAKIGMNTGGMADAPGYPAVHDNANPTVITSTYHGTSAPALEAVDAIPRDKPDSHDGIDSPSDDLDAYQAMEDQENEESKEGAHELSQEQRQPNQDETRPGGKSPDEHLSTTQEKRLKLQAEERSAGQDAYKHSGRPR